MTLPFLRKKTALYAGFLRKKRRGGQRAAGVAARSVMTERTSVMSQGDDCDAFQ